MKDENIDEILDNLLIYLPLFYQKAIKPKNQDIKQKHQVYYQILGILEHFDNLPISHLGKRLFVSKPNMTSHIDKLVKDGMVERVPDERDRRIIRVRITDKGLGFIKESREIINEIIKYNLSPLNESELEELNGCLRKIRGFMHKIDTMEEIHRKTP